MNRALDEDTGDDARTVDDGTLVDENATVDATATSAPPLRHQSFTRGMNPRAALSWVRGLHGEAGIRELVRALPRDVVDDLGGPALKPPTMTWLPFLSHAALLQAIDDVFGKGDLEHLITVGRAMAFHDFPVVARPFARLLSPGLFIDMAVKIWGLYHSHGRWEILRGPRDVRGILLDRPEHHPAFCAAMRGWVEGALMFCGAVEASSVEDRCAARGAPHCSLRGTWKERRDDVRDRRPRPPT